MTRIEISILRNGTGERITSEDDLRLLISKVIVIVGLKKAPHDLIVAACWKILDHFSSFTKAQFMEAFELNEAQVYAKRVEHFGEFLPAYMSEVLNLYRGLKNRAEIEYKRALVATLPQPIPETGEDCFKSLKKQFDENGELPRFWNWTKVFLYLEEIGAITLTIPEKKNIANIVKAKIEAQKKGAADLAELKEFDRILNGEGVVVEARKYCINEYFNKFAVKSTK